MSLIAERSMSTLVYCIITPRIECGPAACAQVGRAADAKDKGSEGGFRASVARKAVC